MKKVDMYHISRHFIGREAKFKPRIPISQNKCETGLPPRICAADSVEKCWDAIRVCRDLITEMKKSNYPGFYFFVYRFKNPSLFVKNNVVMDAHSTNEHISYEDADAELIDVFYCDSWRLLKPLLFGYEKATIEEAIEAYNEWQKETLQIAEKTVEEMEW